MGSTLDILATDIFQSRHSRIINRVGFELDCIPVNVRVFALGGVLSWWGNWDLTVGYAYSIHSLGLFNGMRVSLSAVGQSA